MRPTLNTLVLSILHFKERSDAIARYAGDASAEWTKSTSHLLLRMDEDLYILMDMFTYGPVDIINKIQVIYPSHLSFGRNWFTSTRLQIVAS